MVRLKLGYKESRSLRGLLRISSNFQLTLDRGEQRHCTRGWLLKRILKVKPAGACRSPAGMDPPPISLDPIEAKDDTRAWHDRMRRLLDVIIPRFDVGCARRCFPAWTHRRDVDLGHRTAPRADKDRIRAHGDVLLEAIAGGQMPWAEER